MLPFWEYTFSRYIMRWCIFIYLRELQLHNSNLANSSISPSGTWPLDESKITNMDSTKVKNKTRDTLLTGMHAIAFAQFAFAVYYDYTYTAIPRHIARMHSAFGGKFKFLTFWNAILQAVFFFVCLLNDFGGSNELCPAKRPILRRVKDFFHASLGFPVAMFVGVTFWALMAVDRELVLPAAIDAYFPWWLNHLMHTLIMVTTLLEMIIAPRQYPKRLSGLGGLLLFMAAYLVWLLIIYAVSEIWVYPVMEVLSWPLRIVFFLVLFLFTAILYILGEYLDRLIWGRAKKSVGKSAKKKKSK
ncbi:androgen-induced gene 1 protein-like isoform X2 [Diprion similis]|uniref:androgen-induced gene 1 protein-like isoform X2 n=1 Tax=Diprion similis TaxID=362088 RepID=UPI001EF84883|nr:androgen-induced gene 1 protein-like isoform X2 [Diprion similis]XP_046753504.1 androgen-induced gene 1 protein-like isoform X2 [Diprion similis]